MMYGTLDTRFAAFIWEEDPEMIDLVVETIATSLYYEYKLKDMGIDFEEDEEV